MRKLSLTVIGMYALFLHAFSQSTPETSGSYKSQQLKVDEINLVSGYYSQDGNHSAVTGGKGSQQLTDISNVVQIKFLRWDELERKHSLEVELGVDHHTAASSAYVSLSGASRTGGTRIYPSLNWKTEDEKHHNAVNWGIGYSGEYNYQSYNANLGYTRSSKDENREFSSKLQIFADRVKMIIPSELKTTSGSGVTTVTTASGQTITNGGGDDGGIPSKGRFTFNLSNSYSRVINKNMQIALLVDGVLQTGYLGMPFYRVVLHDGTTQMENLPTIRAKLPLGLRFNYFAGDKVIFRTYYRYYVDTWGMQAHTLSLEVPFKFGSFFSISPFYRYYDQTAAFCFAPYGVHVEGENYYTSNYNYSAFQSQYVGLNVRFAPASGIFGIRDFSMLELRGGYYVQTTGLKAFNISMNLKFK